MLYYMSSRPVENHCMTNNMPPWPITKAITCIESPLIYCMIQYILRSPDSITWFSLVAAAATAIAASPRRRDQRARGEQSFYCWADLPGNNPALGDPCEVLAAHRKGGAASSVVRPRGPGTAEVEQCRWWWAVPGMSRMRLRNNKAVLPIAKIESAGSKFITHRADWGGMEPLFVLLFFLTNKK